ncbi:hypothetical protein CDS [Salmonella enterica subsp. enterica serovar Derby]|nr:hypothetical protein CDS [Salmonella enterica subsp. enterica serovar Derby]
MNASLRFIKIGKPGKKIQTLTSQVTETSGRSGNSFPDGAGLGKPQARQCF